MKKMKFVLPVMLIILSLEYSQAQDYRTALGLRLGSWAGVTAKHFLNPGAAIEGLLTSRWDGFVITGLYQFTGNAFSEPNLGWYLGGGAHVGFWSDKRRTWRNRGDSGSIFGVDFIVGLEYTFMQIPLNLALDWKPAVNLIGHHGFWGDEFALSIRFAIK
jgi:hypothetical protein